MAISIRCPKDNPEHRLTATNIIQRITLIRKITREKIDFRVILFFSVQFHENMIVLSVKFILL